MTVEITDRRELHLTEIRNLPSYSRLTPTGVDYVEHVLASPPSRVVGANSLMSMSGAVAARFPYMVDYESSSCERPFVLLSVLDEQVVDLLSQPKQLIVVKHDTRGRRSPTQYTPDYLCIRKNEIALVEAKPLETLQEKAAESTDWSLCEGRWRYRPGDEAAAARGMVFEVFCPEDFNPVYLTNLQYLVRASSTRALDEGIAHVEKARRLLESRPMSISELCARLSGLTGAIIYQAIREKLLFGFIEQQLLEPGFIVYAGPEQALEQSAFLERMNSRASPATQGPMQSRLATASANELASAMARQSKYQKRMDARVPKNATDYRIETAIRAAEAEGASPLAAFVPDYSSRGRKPLMIAQHGQEIKEHADAYLQSGRVPKVSRMYADYAVEAEDAGRDHPRRETYRKIFLRQIAPEKAAFAWGGKKAFHANRPRTDGAVATPRLRIAGLHVHIDGVYGDVRAAPDEEGAYARPIFYPLIDDATGFALGRGVKLGRGCRLAIGMAHRDCYQRHGILPSKIIHDWGSEFVNTFVPPMVAHFNVGYERRPKSAPRFGAMGEMFNAQLSAYLQELAGGTYFDRLGRSVDGKKKSRATARLTFRQIIEATDHWIFNVWNKSPFGDEDKSPEEQFNESIRCFPEACVRVQEELLHRYATSLPLKAKAISYIDGFRFGGSRFNSTKLPGLLREGIVPASPRLDCMDPSIVYAMTPKGVIALRSLEYKRISGLSFDRRMEEMLCLLESRSISAVNQHERNKKEARLLREKERESEVMKEEIPSSEAHTGTKRSSPDFSDIGDAPLLELEIYGS